MTPAIENPEEARFLIWYGDWKNVFGNELQAREMFRMAQPEKGNDQPPPAINFDVRQETSVNHVERLIRRFADAARSAASKEYQSELTEEEACALCFFSGVPYEIDSQTGRMKFQPCGLYKRDGKWVVVTAP